MRRRKPSGDRSVEQANRRRLDAVSIALSLSMAALVVAPDLHSMELSLDELAMEELGLIPESGVAEPEAGQIVELAELATGLRTASEPEVPEKSAPTEEEVEPVPPSEDAVEILGEFVEPGTVARLVLRSSESFAGATLETPVVVVHGKELGETLCIIAGVHGDEVNGVEVVRRILLQLDVDELKGTVIAVPIANPSAFLRGSRYLLDRRDLNRYFPGHPSGSSASRIAHNLFEKVIRKCDALIDLHTGSFKRTNFSQLRANLSHEKTVELAAAYGAGVVVNSMGRVGTLRRSVTEIDIPAITVEAGAPALFEESHVEAALDGVAHLLSARGMLLGPQMAAPRPDTMAYLRTRWIRADQGGILVSRIGLGDVVESGQILGTISDPLSEEVVSVVSPIEGRVIGMALDQLVMPGFAAYHIGFESRPLSDRIPRVADAAEEALEESPEGVDLEDRPE
jgi:predicted deacylase